MSISTLDLCFLCFLFRRFIFTLFRTFCACESIYVRVVIICVRFHLHAVTLVYEVCCCNLEHICECDSVLESLSFSWHISYTLLHCASSACRTYTQLIIPLLIHIKFVWEVCIFRMFISCSDCNFLLYIFIHC